MTAWHFDNKPYNLDHLNLPTSASMWAQQPSASWFLTEAMITAGGTTTRFALNFMTRFVLHIIGDIHQPLHATNGYFNDTRFGDVHGGDLGGNLIFVTSDCGTRNLHAFWDAGGCLYIRNWPLSDSENQALAANASELMSKYSKDSFGSRYRSDDLTQCWSDAIKRRSNVKMTCSEVFERWVNESWTFAVKDVYTGVEAGKPLSLEYVSRAHSIVKKELVLGGYRLADVLRHFAVQAKAMPPPVGHNGDGAGGQWTDTAKVLLGISVALLTVVLAEAIVLVSFSCKHTMARNRNTAEISDPRPLINPRA